MASRRRASKRKSSEIDSELDMTNPRNWTKEQLITEINNIGIKVPNNLRVASLVQIYSDNKKDGNQDEIPAIVPNDGTKDITKETPTLDVEAAAAQVMKTLTNRGTTQNTNNVQNFDSGFAANTRYTVPINNPVFIPDSVFSVQNNVGNSSQFQQQTFDMNKVLTAMNQPGVAAENYRNVEVVSPQLRSQIIAGKDINLALLLMPNNDSTSEHRRVDVDGLEYILKPGDPRLSKNLTLGEFIVAFGKYKNIVCEVLPHRRTELDHYERDVVEMANNFGGTRFYDYHKAFSAKAAALLHQRNIKVDWSIRDNGLFCSMFAGMKINVCGLCSSVNHASDFCPLMVNPNLKKSNTGNIGYNKTQTSSSATGYTKKVPTYQGRQLCINFNERSCQRPACKFLHLCFDCFSPHPKSKCHSKTNDIGEGSVKGKVMDKKSQDKTDKVNQ